MGKLEELAKKRLQIELGKHSCRPVSDKLTDLCPVCEMPTDRGELQQTELSVCTPCQHNHLAPVVLDLRSRLNTIADVLENFEEKARKSEY